MSDDAAARFLSDFALPLCAGGAVHVGAPLGPRGLHLLLETARTGLDGTEAGVRLRAARHRIMSELLLRCEPPFLRDDPGALRLLVALHDLLFLVHPTARRTLPVRSFAQRLCTAPAMDPELLVARHSLLTNLWTLSRDDVRITYWAGSREFHGAAPPPRLLAWPSLRRVREERWRVVLYLQLLGIEGGRDAVNALLQMSPLTDLLSPKRLDPPLDLSRHGALLRLPAVRRAALHQYLALGLSEVGGPLGAALLRLLEKSAALPDRLPRTDLQAVLHFTCQLLLCTLLTTAPSSLLPLGAERGLRDLCGILCALCLRWPSFALPKDVLADAPLSQRIREHTSALSRSVGQGRLDDLIGLCARALGSATLIQETNIEINNAQ